MLISIFLQPLQSLLSKVHEALIVVRFVQVILRMPNISGMLSVWDKHELPELVEYSTCMNSMAASRSWILSRVMNLYITKAEACKAQASMLVSHQSELGTRVGTLQAYSYSFRGSKSVSVSPTTSDTAGTGLKPSSSAGALVSCRASAATRR